MKAHNQTYPQVVTPVTVIGLAGFVDTVYRDGTVVTTHQDRHYQTYRPGDNSDFAVRARESAAQFFN